MNKTLKISLYLMAIFTCFANVFAKDKEIKAEDFLRRIRYPFMQATYWKMSGDVQTYTKGKGRKTEKIEMEIVYDAKEMRSVLIFAQKDLYRTKQINNLNDTTKNPHMVLVTPEKPTTMTMADINVEPEDVTFAFIYWDLVYDFKHEKIKGQKCRLLELKHPDKEQRVLVWFSVEYGFPLQVYYYRNGEQNPWRILEFKDFKKYKKDFWFVKTMLVRDPRENWRTQFTFKDAEMEELPQKKELPDLPLKIKFEETKSNKKSAEK